MPQLFASLYEDQEVFVWSECLLDHDTDSLDSKADRKMDVTREHIGRILELRKIVLSFRTGFTLVKAAVVCAFLERISGLEPSSVISEPRYLKLVTVSSFCPLTLTYVLMSLVLFELARSSRH